MTQPDPIAMRRAMDAAIAAGAPVSVLAMLSGNQIAKVVTLLMQSSPLPLRFDLEEEQLEDPTSTEDGWTLKVRWDRPTAEDVEKAASMGIGRDVPASGNLPVAFGGQR
jgi:hypothetical protein